jgi:uncharacterized protein YjbI with pentapeptide repeats
MGGSSSSKEENKRDWVQILLAPLLIGIIGVGLTAWFNTQQNERQIAMEERRAEEARHIEEQRAQDEALQAYLDQMTQLLVQEDLRHSDEGSEVRTLARARTLTILRRVDPDRQGAIIQFLYEANLINRSKHYDDPPEVYPTNDPVTVVRLEAADLQGANLSGAELSDVFREAAKTLGVESKTDRYNAINLSFTDLRDSDLSGTLLVSADLFQSSLDGADLTNAVMTVANLRGATLTGADLRYAKLGGAYLDNAQLGKKPPNYASLPGTSSGASTGSASNLSNATLTGASLTSAILGNCDLSHADLSNADLSFAQLNGANLTDARLDGANFDGANLEGADLTGAKGITKEQLEQQAESLRGATLPDRSKSAIGQR